MRQVLGRVGVGIVMCAVMGTLNAAAASSGLEGTTWKVRVIPDQAAAKQGEKPFNDALIFQDGKVTMSACVKSGFAASAYTASSSNKGWDFKTQQASKKAGQTVWTATITGHTIKGAMVWTKNNGTVLHYAVEGKQAT